MKLSKYFSLEEFTRSATATRLGITNTPNEVQIERMRWLSLVLLEPIRKKFGKVNITSGYRSEELNKKVGGSLTSSHSYPEGSAAVDISTPAALLLDVFSWIINSGLPFDQVILERGKEERHELDDTIHIAMKAPVFRRQALLGPTHGQGEYTTVEVPDSRLYS